MNIEIKLPVPEHLQLFLKAKFGEEYHTTNRDWFGIQILSLLEKKSVCRYALESCKSENYSMYYKIKIRFSHSDRFGIILPPHRENMLRKFVESLFRDACFEFALINKELYDIDYKSSIINFLNYYNIDETKGTYLETIVRDFNRKKKNANQLK